MQNIKYKILILSILTSFTFLSYAQKGDQSPAAIEKMKLNWLWNRTTNAAGLQLDNSSSYTLLESSYNIVSGNFHRVMDGEKYNRLAFRSEGGAKIHNFYFWGKFNYFRDAIKDSKFNASMINPYRGIPYLVTDTNTSNWNNQHYELEFKVNFPKITEKLLLGISGAYYTSIGAKQRDIRTENYYMELKLRPGIVYLIDKQNNLGLNFEYSSLKEESNMRNTNYYIDQPYYELRGLGNAIIGIGSGRTTNYVGNNLGGGIQYNYSGAVNLMLTSNYLLGVEDVENSFTNPKKEGSILKKVWSSKAILHTETDNDFSHSFELEYLYSHRDGIEYIKKYDDSGNFGGYITLFKNIRSTYANKDLRFSYTLTKNQDNEYKWMLGAKVNYTKYDDEYILPNSIRNGENILGELSGKRNFMLSGQYNKRIIIGIGCLYNKNISGNYLYGGAFKKYPIHSQLIKVDNDYNNSDYFSGKISGVYSQKLKKETDMNLFIKASYLFSKTSSYNFDNRESISISVGCTF